MEIHHANDIDDKQILQKLSKEEIWNKYQNEIIQLKKENEELHTKKKVWEQKYIDQKRLYEHSENQELLKKNKELQEAELVMNHQKEQINLINIQQKDEIDALQKKLQSNKCALDAMKKTLDNEKAFRICADEEIKNLKEQIKCNSMKYKSLETENEKLISEKCKIEEAKNKISQQCNELIQKNISLENYCEKKELAFDKQTNLVNTFENSIAELKEKINNYEGIKEENKKLVTQMKSFSKELETYENEREMYVQRLQKIQKEENELKYMIKNLKKEANEKNNTINNLNENNTNLTYKILEQSNIINNLQTNFSSCLKFLDDIFENYINSKKVDHDKLLFQLKPFLNEAFELFEHTLTKYKLLESSYKNSETILQDEINKKEKNIKSLNDIIENYKQKLVKNDTVYPNLSQIVDTTEELDFTQFPSNITISNNLILYNKLKTNLICINKIKNETLPKQKLLLSEYQECMLNKLKEIENVNTSKNTFIEKLQIEIEHLDNELIDKNTFIEGLKSEVLKLEKQFLEKNTLCNEMEIELLHFRDNCDNLSTTSINKADEINRLREIDESQEDRSQKLKAIAIKQKKQIADLKQLLENEMKKHNLEKNEFMNKMTSLVEQSKLARCLQQQYDIKCDEYDIKCDEIKELCKTKKEVESKLLEQTKLFSNMKLEVETLKNDLLIAQKTVYSLKEVEKALNSKLEVIKQEKSANEILKVDREKSIKEFSSNLKLAKDKMKLMESEIEKLKTEKQKMNIRDLELNSYEKTLDELSQKVKEEKLNTQSLEQELSNANSVIDSLHEQIKLLENIISTEQERNKQNVHQIEVYRTGLNNAESLLNEKENNLIECQKALDHENILNKSLTNKYDELKEIYETEQKNYQLKHSQLNEKIRRLQIEINTANDSISKYTDENQILLDEFEAYKVRAHSVFQKHKQDTVYNSKVSELSDQLHSVTKALNLSKTNLQNVLSDLSTKNTEISMLKNEVDKYDKKLNNLIKTLSTKDKKIYHLSIEIENLKSVLEKEKIYFNETILSKKLLYEKEIEKLQQEIILAKESNTPTLNTELPITEHKLKELNFSNHIQEDDEIFSDFASSNESVRKISKSTLMPLEDLLSYDNNSVGDPINELNTSHKQLKQLSLMLNEAEKNCSRYEQQNKFLKEDIRRLQRSVDRHAEIQNMEYLKNIIIKFLTLSSGVEKCHLVPVINKLLKLSPDEQKQIETIAKGVLVDQNSSWSSLFTWSQGN